MKQIIGIVAVVLWFAGCATALTSAEKTAGAQRREQQLADGMARHTFIVDVNYVTPRRMSPRFLTAPYRVELANDSLKSYLPYFGVAYHADISHENRSPLDFEAPVTAYESHSNSKGEHRITVEAGQGLEHYTYLFEIYPNGKASLDVIPSGRESISFSGEFRFKE